jgi:hypothetical protein
VSLVNGKYVYPGRNCKAGNDCRSCPTFRCRACGKQRPWCVGASDPHPDWCSTCYVSRHRRLRGRFCGARGCDEHGMFEPRARNQEGVGG